jgi:hypothetical protein
MADRFVDCLCWGFHSEDCPNHVSVAEIRARYRAIATEAGTAELRILRTLYHGSFCWWVFEFLGMTPEDEIDDLFPGSGAVGEALATWREAKSGNCQVGMFGEAA